MPGVPDGIHPCRLYRLWGVATWNFGATEVPYAWTRASGTIGWRDSAIINNFADVPWAEIDGDIGMYGMALQTMTYRVLTGPGDSQHLAWFPAEPAACRIAFTTLGRWSTVDVAESPPTSSPGLRISNSPSIGRISAEFVAAPGDKVRLVVHDALGRSVRLLYSGTVSSPACRFVWDGTDSNGRRCSPGVYFVRLEAGGVSQARRAVLLQ